MAMSANNVAIIKRKASAGQLIIMQPANQTMAKIMAKISAIMA